MKLELDDISFSLKKPFDFGFLAQFGRVFQVFDQNDSGNISFGLSDGIRSFFVKVAGAQTQNSSISPQEAVENLKRATSVYQDLAHPTLIQLLDHGPIVDGYFAVFDWVDGECMHAHWTFDQYPKYTHEKSPYYRYRRLPLEKRLHSLSKIFAFHLHVAEQEYVAIDFYDGSILYNFDTDRTCICDIDLYAKAPYTNRMGRLWGSSRFMSPEEFTLGAAIDQTTNVYTMGATAFVLLGGEENRSIENWEAGAALHAVAIRAVASNRDKRFSSMAAFVDAWNQALTR